MTEHWNKEDLDFQQLSKQQVPDLVCEGKNCKFLQNVIKQFNWLKLNIATLIVMWLVATVINFLTKVSLENYATTQLGQKKSNILTFTLSPV